MGGDACEDGVGGREKGGGRNEALVKAMAVEGGR